MVNVGWPVLSVIVIQAQVIENNFQFINENYTQSLTIAEKNYCFPFLRDHLGKHMQQEKQKLCKRTVPG